MAWPGFAVLLMVVGVLTGSGPLFMQGLLIVGVPGGSWLVQRARAARSSRGWEDREPDH